jgi:hypothetical protein
MLDLGKYRFVKFVTTTITNPCEQKSSKHGVFRVFILVSEKNVDGLTLLRYELPTIPSPAKEFNSVDFTLGTGEICFNTNVIKNNKHF